VAEVLVLFGLGQIVCAEEIKLQKGDAVQVVIKSTEVMIRKD
jgi:molybdopterin-binding protein